MSIRIGERHLEYTTDKVYWLPRGYSKRSGRYVYPHQGWSWTEWRSEVTDTYETLERAQQAISGGYLKDMIKSQEIVDIVILQVRTVREIVEDRTIVAHDLAGKPLDRAEPSVSAQGHVLEPGAYVFLNYDGDADPTTYAVYGKVLAIHEDRVSLWVVNGAWTMVLTAADGTLRVAPESHGPAGREVFILYAGEPPNPLTGSDFYTAQFNAYLKLRGLEDAA
ncbi:hypothetical protein phiCbK_287 [Caulobacter phage phiCbK]|uniref:Uncharacterized protein n=5 Tax=Viruses TaxID=10239 RepID=K4JNU1_9CAUD|nr:hypothetical protein D865_gp032 [Caulobacter phage phiCbK]AFO71803.1 hypothetical protein phiCbK_287 [Caulobacter phage phiCbK]AFU86864.1 hypothetical protein CbK_gp032 [Caulobacter phage phiCbK]ARB14951.1 hypothetical protein Ccr32_gp032 [Caulobacter phage Ccr32]ARB15282.1 hypothetical protein Ccr34_gp033 [Caulobacter phage Ccr34]